MRPRSSSIAWRLLALCLTGGALGAIEAPPPRAGAPAPELAARPSATAGSATFARRALPPRRWIPRPVRPRDSAPRARSEAAVAGSLDANPDSLAREFRRQWSSLRRHPSQSRPHLRLGELYYRIGNDYAARHHLERFLEAGASGPDSLRAAQLRARSLIRLERYLEAIVALELLARKANAPPAVHHDLSLLLRRDRRPAEALMAEMRAVECAAGDLRFAREAAAQWKELGRADQALALGEVLARDPRAEAEDRFQAGYMAHRFGRLAEAAGHYEAAIARDREHAEAHYNLALIRQDEGGSEAAIAHWREVVRLRPAYDPAYFQLGTLLLELRRTAEATALFEDYLQSGTDFPAMVEAAGILNTLGVPPERWRALLDARTEMLGAEGKARRAEEEARLAAQDSARAAGDSSGAPPAGPAPIPLPAEND